MIQHGSTEMGGDGLCYTCQQKRAEPGGWNCAECKANSNTRPVGEDGKKADLPIPVIQKKLMQMAQEERDKQYGYTRHPVESVSDDTEDDTLEYMTALVREGGPNENNPD